MSAQDQANKTIDPTPQRIRQFRERGEIARSKDLTGAATMFFGGVVMVVFATDGFAALDVLFRLAFGQLGAASTEAVGGATVDAFLETCLPPAAGGFAALMAATFIQLGAPPAFSKPKFNLLPMLQLKGLGEMVKPKAAAWRTLKSILKVVFVGVAGWVAVGVESEAFLAEPALAAPELLVRGRDAGFRVLLYAGVALMVLAVADYVVAKRRMFEKMKMSPEELKREIKQQEGDPEIKRARRRRMQEIARRRIAVDVPNADVVVVNPTHYAVALVYKRGEDAAPRVVAKGVDAMAAQIRELARKAGVPIVSKPPLARLLYRTVQEGRHIPEEVFHAVAEVLSYVYRLKRGVR